VTEGAPGRVSVIIPSYDYADYLPQAIDSVLEQDDSGDFEVIVVDDGSRDRTDAVLASFGERIRAIVQPHGGAAAALNRGIAAATGSRLAFLDADDLWPARKLAVQRAVLDRESSLEGVFGHAEEFVSPELTEIERARIVAKPGTVPAPVAGSLLIRRDAFMRVGAFAEGRFAEFVDWYSRASDVGLRTRMLPDVCVRRRLHLRNSTRVHRDWQSDYLRILKTSLDRRRAAADAGRAD
jgi:glycosyltransferase involved in cell wall biosynthesis